MMPRKRLILPILLLVILLAGLIGRAAWQDHLNRTREFKGSVTWNGREVSIDLCGKGSPTIIFEPGLNESWQCFLRNQKEMSKLTKTFSYNRVGLNYCEKKGTRSAQLQVDNLYALLQSQKIKGPYLLVAHSIGGFNARLFAASYPNEVAGIILVDSSYENQPWSRSKIRENGELNYEEILQSAAQVREANKQDALRHIPLTVLTADYKGRREEVYFPYILSYHKIIAKLSDISTHTIITDSGHIIQAEHPEAVNKAITDMLKLIQE